MGHHIARTLVAIALATGGTIAVTPPAITPHVRRAPKRKPPRMSGPRYFNLMRAIENNPDQYADFRPTNYCGAPLTTEDWSRRSAIAKKNAELVVESRVCHECLRLAAER